MNAEPIHTWVCPRCGLANPEHGETPIVGDRRDAWGKARDGSSRICGIECECGLTRAGWLVGKPEYQYPVPGGHVDVRPGKTTVYRALPNDPNEYTPATESEIVVKYCTERFDITSALAAGRSNL